MKTIHNGIWQDIYCSETFVYIWKDKIIKEMMCLKMENLQVDHKRHESVRRENSKKYEVKMENVHKKITKQMFRKRSLYW